MSHRQPLTRGRGDLIASGPLGVKWCVSKLSLSPRWAGVDGLTLRDTGGFAGHCRILGGINDASINSSEFLALCLRRYSRNPARSA
jgi:hypothetical protein